MVDQTRGVVSGTKQDGSITLVFPVLSLTYRDIRKLKIRRSLRSREFSQSRSKLSFDEPITSSRALTPQTFSSHGPIRKQIVMKQRDIGQNAL
jgi:hypothetical protein